MEVLMEIHGASTNAISSFISGASKAVSSASSKVYNTCKSAVGSVSSGFQKVTQGAYNRLNGEHKASRESAKNTAIYNSITPSAGQMQKFLDSLPHDLRPSEGYAESKTTIDDNTMDQLIKDAEKAKADAKQVKADAKMAEANAKQDKADAMRETFDELGF